MLAPTLRRNRRRGAFQDFQQRLLHALTGDIAGNRRVFALARNLVDLVDINDAALSALHIKIGGLQQLQQDIFHVFADIAGLGQRRGIGNSKRHIQHTRQGLRQVGLTRAGWAQHQDIGFRDLNIFFRMNGICARSVIPAG